ncbi:MAG: OPT/YSL family transporter [Armatimonadetes bacterium]|nr:OPT/YSL family transporter [Armatimonadota bacterium]
MAEEPERQETQEERELAEFRSIMEEPETYEEGLTWVGVVGAIFIGFIMMPASIYLGLVAGQTMGPAAVWVTIILFTEIAKRAFVKLRRQEVYMLYYIAGGLTSMVGAAALSGGPFAQLIWNQYLACSPASASFAKDIPRWVTPPYNSPAILQRTFFHADWMPAIWILLIREVLSRINWFGLGYALFRVTCDIERLTFPMAPVAAQGAMALAETTGKEETWRWRVFSFSTMLGIVFGVIYVALPAISNLVLVRPIALLPIPWIDFTAAAERWFPATPLGIGTSLQSVVVGMVLPFWVVMGTTVSALGSVVINPVLYHFHLLHQWQPGMDTVYTTFANGLDFYISFGIGTGLSIALIGLGRMAMTWRQTRVSARRALPAGRGDISMWLALTLYLVTTVLSMWLCKWLVPEFPTWALVFFGLIWTPLNSYINARMLGVTGQFVPLPFVREATFILSGYKGVAIWFAPIPFANYGAYAQSFREVQLTGTKFTSVIKAEILMMFLLFGCSLLFWSYIWKLNPIPHVSYPYAQKFWEFTALQQAFWISSTRENSTAFKQAISMPIITSGVGAGLGVYFLFTLLRWPVLSIYGFIRGLGQIPHFFVPEFIGALLGRYYFARKYGTETWRRYTPVVAAGFACGMGLSAMVSIAAALIFQSLSELPF